MGKYCDKSGMKCTVSSVFTCKIAKKNHHFITFGLKVVLLQAKKNHRKLKELMELKKLKKLEKLEKLKWGLTSNKMTTSDKKDLHFRNRRHHLSVEQIDDASGKPRIALAVRHHHDGGSLLVQFRKQLQHFQSVL